MNQKVSRRYGSPAQAVEMDILKRWGMIYHAKSKLHDAIVAINLNADTVDLEIEAFEFPDLEEMGKLSDTAKMVVLARISQAIGFEASFGEWSDGEKKGIRLEWEK